MIDRDAIARYVVPDPYLSSRRLAVYTELLSQSDPSDLPPRRTRVCRAGCGPRPINRNALLVWLHSAHVQHQLLEARGEVT